MLLAFLREQGCQVAGDSFETDLISYLATQDEEDFILKLEVQVKRRKARPPACLGASSRRQLSKQRDIGLKGRGQRVGAPAGPAWRPR